MQFFWYGLLAFAAFFLYDVNCAIIRKKYLHILFSAGCILLVYSTAMCLYQEYRPGISIGFTAAAILFFAAMIYTLFFALPFQDTYVKQGKSPLYDRGMYALCRHPGVLWFCLMYAALALAWNSRLFGIISCFYSLFNIAYVVFQDLWTFPRTFEGYEAYREHTPFLLPTWHSIVRAWQTRR